MFSRILQHKLRNGLFATAIACLGFSSFAQADTQSFIGLGDIHFNPYAACLDNAKKCDLFDKLRTAPVSQWQALLTGNVAQVPSHSGSDTNEALLDSTLTYLSSLPKTYQFVVLDGDFIGHHFRESFAQYTSRELQTDTPKHKLEFQKQYQAFVLKTYQYLELRFSQALPNTPIYIALGNNDAFMDDYYSMYYPQYYSKINIDFYNQMANTWKKDINNAANQARFMATFPIGGYYSIALNADSPDRILVLNTNLYSTRGQGHDLSELANRQWLWLETQLSQIRQQHGHAIIMDHIPNGIDVNKTIDNTNANQQLATTMFWQDADQAHYNDEFRNILNQYPDVITSVISTHIHMDAYQLLTHNGNMVTLNTFIPAISPRDGNNPAFKVYQYETGNLDLLNFQTYYAKAKLRLEPKWTKEYDFDQTYRATNLLEGYERIGVAGPLAETYQKYFDAGAKSQYITQGYWTPYYWCGIQYQTADEYTACVNSQ
jgi:hypothetical protein